MFTKVLKFKQHLGTDLGKIIANTFWLMADNILRMSVGLVVGVWVARYLGPNQFGLLNYAMSMAGMFSVIAKAGLDEILIRDLVRETTSTSRNEILGTGFALKLASGSLAFLISVGAIFLISTDDFLTPWLVSIIALGMIFQSLDVIDLWFQSQVQSKNTVYAKNAAYILANAIKVVLITQKAPLIAFAIITFAEVAFSSIGLAIVYRMVGHSFKLWKASFPLAIKFLKQSWPNILTGFSITVYMRVDQLMLANMVGNEAVGNYAVGVRLAEIWYFVPIAIVSSITPKIVQAKEEGENVYYARIQKALNLLVAIFYLICIGMTCFSQPIMNLLYGSKYAVSSSILAVYVWAGIFVSMGLVRNAWITTEGMFRFGSATTFLGAGLNVILNLILIPYYGAVGAAIATVLSYGISDYLILLFYPPSRKLGWCMARALALDFITSKLRERLKNK
jgi:PST family polysaccharide transporter